MDLDQATEDYLIQEIRNSCDWKRQNCQRGNINNPRVKEAIRASFPGTFISNWKKEFAWYRHKDGSEVEIHRFVNLINQREEFNVKIKRFAARNAFNALAAAAKQEPDDDYTEYL